MTQTSTINRKEISAAEKAARAEVVSRGDVLRGIMSQPTGREWIWGRLTAANVFSSVYSENPIRMAFLEGHRNAGLDLLNDVMEFCPDQFILAMREANGRRINERIKPASAGYNGDAGGSEPEAGGFDDGSGFDYIPDPSQPGGYRIQDNGSEARFQAKSRE